MDTSFPLAEAPMLSQLEVVLHGRHYILNPAEDLRVTPSALGEDLQTQPGLYAFYATLKDLAVAKVSLAVRELQATEGTYIHNWRAEGLLPSGARVTEDGIRQALRAEPQLKKLQELVVLAEKERDLLTSITVAFEHRRSVLNALATRANNTSIQDRDVATYVSGSYQREDVAALKSSTKGRGAFPGSK